MGEEEKLEEKLEDLENIVREFVERGDIERVIDFISRKRDRARLFLLFLQLFLNENFAKISSEKLVAFWNFSVSAMKDVELMIDPTVSILGNWFAHFSRGKAFFRGRNL